VIPIFHLAFHVKALDGIAIQVAIVLAFRNNDVLEAPNIIVGFPCVAQISRPSRTRGARKISEVRVADRLPSGRASTVM